MVAKAAIRVWRILPGVRKIESMRPLDRILRRTVSLPKLLPQRAFCVERRSETEVGVEWCSSKKRLVEQDIVNLSQTPGKPKHECGEITRPLHSAASVMDGGSYSSSWTV
jgi:hypothetical protein